MKMPAKTWMQYVSWGLLAILCYYVFVRSYGYCWDFKVYCERARDFIQQGTNPHTVDSWPYTYPPMTLYLFWPFYILPVATAVKLWILLKIVAFAWMIRVWNKHFSTVSLRNPFTVFFICLAFNGAVFYDIASGNIAGFQQLLLWLAFAALMEGKVLWFSIAIVLIGQIKIDTVFFASTLLFYDRKPHWKAFFVTCSAFLLLYGLNYLLFPDVFLSYLKVLASLVAYNRGVNNPSIHAFLKDFVPSLATWHRPIHLPDISGILHAIFCLVILGLSWLAYRRYSRQKGEMDPRPVFLFLCVIFGLINPRVPPYLYPLMILPCLYIFDKGQSLFPYPFAGALIMLPRADSSFPAPVARTFAVAEPYMQAFGLLIIWYMFYVYLSNQAGSDASEQVGRRTTRSSS